MQKSQSTPFFAHLLDGALPAVKSGVKAGTGAEYTYTVTGPNTAVVTDVIYNPTPWPPQDEES
jgi:hypothetical protein